MSQNPSKWRRRGRRPSAPVLGTDGLCVGTGVDAQLWAVGDPLVKPSEAKPRWAKWSDARGFTGCQEPTAVQSAGPVGKTARECGVQGGRKLPDVPSKPSLALIMKTPLGPPTWNHEPPSTCTPTPTRLNPRPFFTERLLLASHIAAAGTSRRRRHFHVDGT